MSIWLEATILLSVGVITGFINVLAGGGSLLTLPTLIFLGLPGAVANGTNRVALLMQSLVTMVGFRRHKVFPVKTSVMAAVPALIGAWIGAWVAVDLSDELFKPVLGVVMLFVLAIILFDPAKRIKAIDAEKPLLRRIVLFIGFFIVGLYGGFIQAGVGFLIISILLMAGLDLVKINAVKNIVVGIFTFLAMAIFVVNGQVHWLYGFLLGVGNAIGGWAGTHVAVKKGHHWIRRFVIAAVLVFSGKLIFDSFL